MTTFKNNAKYADLLFTYLDAAYREDTPLTVPEVLRIFQWNFKGGSLREAAAETRLCPETSWDRYPNGLSESIAEQWPSGREARALAQILRNRRLMCKLKSRGVMARLASYQMLTSSYGVTKVPVRVFSGMKAIYHLFAQVWDWAPKAGTCADWNSLMAYSRELLLGSAGVSRVDLPSVEELRIDYVNLLAKTRIAGLLQAVKQVKGLIRLACGREASTLARVSGMREKSIWGLNNVSYATEGEAWELSDHEELTLFIPYTVGPLLLRVSQQVCCLGTGPMRYALGKSDMERFHQLLMSSASALIGVCCQAASGTKLQKSKARLAVEVAERNIGRIVASSRRVKLGDEVLVCKGYRRAYTAHLGVLAGPMCASETRVLITEAEETAPVGVLDVEGYLWDAKSLDAASSLNALKVFKICPAPDVSPGGAMMDRITQIGNANVVDSTMMKDFKTELTSQILRAYIRSKEGRLTLKAGMKRPSWMTNYLKGEFEKVPSDEIDEYLAWEGDAEMPDVSEYDPGNWKDSSLGVDTIEDTMKLDALGHMGNMITRLIFDEGCPMPGKPVLSYDHVIKFFTKAEGHKDPARGIFSANLVDRQAQSWMEKAVEKVARHHPSFMIGQEIDTKEAKVIQLTTKPARMGDLALFYSFDISGWSAKMPAETQRISHDIWASLHGGHLFKRATEINENAHIYLNMDGYMGWYKNTTSNLEGFNGKEMTMVLVALLSLSVKRWRMAVVEQGIMSSMQANSVSALLFAYIDDGLSRIDLPKKIAVRAFEVYKATVIETFAKCGFTVEVSKCFPSDRFAIFLNEVYLAGRHVVHGVRAAMGISAEPTERHHSLIERVTSVSTGVRGAVMAGLAPASAVLLMAYHVYLHLEEWVTERDPVILSSWSLAPRAWGGLGLPNMMQLFISGSGSAFEEGVATLQAYSSINHAVKKAFKRLCKVDLKQRTNVGILTAPLSGRVKDGYMVDSRVAVAIRKAMQAKLLDGKLSRYASRLLRYSDTKVFEAYADAIIPRDPREILQEQMLINLAECHPHSIFASFARRLEKSMTVKTVVGYRIFEDIMVANRSEAVLSVATFKERMAW